MTRVRFAGVLLGVWVSALPGVALAQTVAAGPYLATPAWDQTLPTAQRFIVLSNMKSEAVLDRETGLVWQRTPLLTEDSNNRGIGSINCTMATTGGRQGWRLPRVDELFSLADPAMEDYGPAHLPVGHPFLGLAPSGTTQVFWAEDTVPTGLAPGGMVVFFNAGGIPGAYLNTLSGGGSAAYTWVGAKVWCVRGGSGGK